MRTAAESRTIAAQALAQRQPEPSVTEALFSLIEREAEVGGFVLTVSVDSSQVDSLSAQLQSLGYSVSSVGTAESPALQVSWE